MSEPNLPPLRVSMSRQPHNLLIDVASLKNSLPELPNTTRDRLMNEYGLSQIFTNNLVVSQFKGSQINDDVFELNLGS